jgi:hypothetical protein
LRHTETSCALRELPRCHHGRGQCPKDGFDLSIWASAWLRQGIAEPLPTTDFNSLFLLIGIGKRNLFGDKSVVVRNSIMVLLPGHVTKVRRRKEPLKAEAF